jgi:hypothetical protein
MCSAALARTLLSAAVLAAFTSGILSVSHSKLAFLNSATMHPSIAHFMTEMLLSGFNACGSSAKKPPVSPSIIFITMMTGPTAKAVSTLFDIAPMLIPRLLADADSSEIVPIIGSQPSLFNEQRGAVMAQ